jgi:hypothetical protein
MKILSFKQFVKEEGSYDTVKLGGDSSGLDNPKVRGALNANLQRATNQHFLTPYMGLGAIARVLAYAHIIVPQYTFLNNDGGEVVFEASPIGHVSGLTVNTPTGAGAEVPPTYHVYFEYQPIGNGYYACFASVVTEDELEELLDDVDAEDEEEENMEGDLQEGIISSAKDEKEQFADAKAHTDHISDVVKKIGKANHLVVSHTGWGDISDGTHEATIHGRRHIAAITTRIHKPKEGKGVDTTYHVTTSVPGEHKKTFAYAEDALSHLAGLMATHTNRFRSVGNALVKKAVQPQRQVAEDLDDFRDNAEKHGVEVSQSYLKKRTRELKPRTGPYSQTPLTQGPAASTSTEEMRYDDQGKIEEARSAECKCTSNFTCGHCLANAKPYHFTPSTSAEIMARQQEKDKPKNIKENVFEEWKNREHFTSDVSKHLSQAAPEVEHLEGKLGKHDTFDMVSDSKFPHHEYVFNHPKGVNSSDLYTHMTKHGYKPEGEVDSPEKKGINSYQKGPFSFTAHHKPGGEVHFAYLRKST